MQRIAGILMPISSLPSPYGIGTLGKEAYRFADFLKSSGCGLWQVLPLQPTSYGDSPYASFSAFALNHYFIDLDALCGEGLLEKSEYADVDWGNDPRRADYGKLYLHRTEVLKKAFARFDKTDKSWKKFLKEGKYRDYALFMAIKNVFGGAPVEEWGELREYDEEKVAKFEKEHKEDVAFWQFTQFEFLRQWDALKAYVHSLGIEIIGDIPFYVASDSVEVWKYKKELFLLDGEGFPEVQAGVPPDAFSETGQLWGNPVYNWEKMRNDNYSWWHRRIEEGLKLYDVLRIDHFIGFARCFCVPIGQADARTGEWVAGPGEKLFKGYEDSRIIAEDLGVLTDEIREMVKRTGYPGMRILQHAFDGNADNEHRPSNYIENCVVYTGTHDNDTLMTRLEDMNEYEYEKMLTVLKSECDALGVTVKCASKEEVCDSILKLMFASKAYAAIFPLQDALRIGREGRINMPSVVSSDNWSYRFTENEFSADLAKRIYAMSELGGRLVENK